LVGSSKPAKSETWRTVGGDLCDQEWELIADLLDQPVSPSKMGRPLKHTRRDIANAIFYVAATGCQWRRLPAQYPPWSTVHGYHLAWSHDGTWEKVCDRLRELVRAVEGRDPEPSAGIIDARSVRGTSTVTRTRPGSDTVTRGYDAAKKISGRKVFGLVDTLGLLIGVQVLAASASDNAGGIAVFNTSRPKSARLGQVWVDAGFKNAFAAWVRARHVAVTVVSRIHPHVFVVLPRRWVVERTWSWLMNNRRLQVDYERDPKVTEGFIWAAHSRLLLHRLTQP
jgi:transposase